MKKCFNKVRIKDGKVNQEKENLIKKWKDLKKYVKNSNENKKELDEVERELADLYAEDYYNTIFKETNQMDSDEGGVSIGNKLWKLKKQIFQKVSEPPTAMLDPKSGNLLTSQKGIEKASIEVYKDRLRNREIKPNLQHIKNDKEILSQKILNIASKNVTPDWTMENLEKVLKNLKKDKSRDPNGLINELFMNEVAGDDLKKEIL